MLLNTWLAAAKRHLKVASDRSRRGGKSGFRRIESVEHLESRALLTALVINPDNQSLYTNAVGGVEIDNADMAGKDSLVIEGISIAATSGDALSIDLSGMTLNSLAIESVTITQYSTVGIDVNLSALTGTIDTVAIEDVRVTGTGLGLELTFTNTDAYALTIDDSVFPGVRVDAVTGSDIAYGTITQNTLSAAAGFEGLYLNVNASTADNFHVVDNIAVNSPNRDFIRIDAADSPLDGLVIENNQIGVDIQGAGLTFRAEGDTFVGTSAIQPFKLTNRSTQNEQINTFVLDLRSIGLEFDADLVTGKPFTALNNTGTSTGLSSAVLSNADQTLTLSFTDFNPGETLQFVIDIDRAVDVPASIFGNNLIGADVSATFTNNRAVAGEMIGDPDAVTASEFAVGPGVAGATQGINLHLTNSPLTNLAITGNTVTSTPGNGILFDANAHSDVTGVVTGNDVRSAGRDGLKF
ncbi:MAG: hypothetical protein KDA85_02315, partial [Planctomycetaceae bacterium]|nr:hypothetical protein [Planctomycetaceae bacterium]